MSEFLDSHEHPDTDALGLWYVADEGYQWGQNKGAAFLMPKAPVGAASVKERAYAIFREKRLVSDFDALAAQVWKLPARSRIQELIKAFADKHGWLGVNGGKVLGSLGEPLNSWKQHLYQWHYLRTTWKAIKTIRSTAAFGRQDVHEQQQSKARETLTEVVQWSEDHTMIGCRRFDTNTGTYQRVLIASARHPEMLNTRHLLKRFNKRDNVSNPGLIEPAEYYVTNEINKVVGATVQYQLLHFGKKARLVPTSLLGGLYFQFLSEVEGTLPRPRRCAFKRCKAKVFTPSRRDKKHCDKRCQQAEWSRRKRAKQKGATNG